MKQIRGRSLPLSSSIAELDEIGIATVTMQEDSGDGHAAPVFQDKNCRYAVAFLLLLDKRPDALGNVGRIRQRRAGRRPHLWPCRKTMEAGRRPQ